MDINIDKYLDRFKVYKSDTLFDVDLTLLKEGRCPLCMNKLKIMRDGKKAFCNSKKHRKSFICSVDKLFDNKKTK